MAFIRNLLLRFLIFIAAVWGLEQIRLLTLLTGIGMAMAIIAALHVWATPENYDY